MNDLISRQSAIEILGKQCNMDYGKVCGKDCECIEYMALRDWPSAQQWIPCSERLPEEGQEVLFSTKTGRVQIGKYSDGDCLNSWFSYCDKCRAWNNVVNAWMPLPEPFKDKHED